MLGARVLGNETVTTIRCQFPDFRAYPVDMRETTSGFGLLRAVLIVVGVALLLMVAFWVAIIAIGIAIVYFLARAVVRAVSGRGRAADPYYEAILIEPGHRENYDNGNVIVLPIEPVPGASTKG